MAIQGFGDVTALANEFNKIQAALLSAFVIQKDSTAGIASMRIRNGKWEIELGS